MAKGYRSSDPNIRIHRRSNISNHFRCPARHGAELQLGDGAIVNREALDRGTWFHACVEAMLMPIRGNKLGTPERQDALPVLGRCPETLRTEVAELVGKWLRRWPTTHVIDVEVLLSSEVLSKSESPDGKAHHIGGRLDLVTHPQMVWDWKSGWGVMTSEASLKDLQIASYGLMASDHYGWSEVDIAVDYPRWGITRVVTMGLPEIKEAAVRLKEYVLDLLVWEKEVAAAKPSEARPGPHCHGCPLLTRCDVAHPEAIRNENDAKLTALAIIQEETKAPRRREILRDYLAKQTGQRLEAGGAIFELALDGHVGVDDPQALAVLLREHGHDVWPLLKVDTDALKKFVKKNPGLREQISTLVVDNRTTRLKIRKE